MPTIFMKSADEGTVLKISNPHQTPVIPQWYKDNGYTVIDQAEFKRIRARLQRKVMVTRGFTNDEGEFRKNIVHLQEARNPK